MLALETIIATLEEGVGLLEKDTLQTSAELTGERRTKIDIMKHLVSYMFCTGNSAVYAVEDGKAVLYLTGRKANPILNNIGEAYEQLFKTGNYKVSSEDMKNVRDSVGNGTVRIELDDLKLKGDNEKYRFYNINTSDYDSLNDSQRAFAEAVYGSGEDFKENMKMLAESGIKNARIYVANPDYVKENAEGNAIAIPCWIDSFSCYSSNFLATVISDSFPGITSRCPMRGVPDQNRKWNKTDMGFCVLDKGIPSQKE